MNSPGQRALLILDAGYVMKCCEKQRRTIDFVKLVNVLEIELKCTFYEKWYLSSVPHHAAEETSFHRMLKSPPPHGPQFRVQLFGLKEKTCPNCKSKSKVQKGVDVAIATLLLKHSFQNLADTIVLFTGDGDFFEAFRIAREELRKTLILVGANDRSVNVDITQLCSKVLWLDSLWQKIEKSTPRKQKPIPAIAKQPPIDASKDQLSAATWTCLSCTFRSSVASTECEICETPRVVALTPAPAPAPVLPIIDLNYPCSTCTFHRKAPISCSVCGTPHK